MNIFVLDYDPKVAAQYHCDEHLGKMITESVQLLSTQIHCFKLGEHFDDLFASTHINHPCRLWISESFHNFTYLVVLAENLYNRYEFYTESIGKEVKYQRENKIIEDFVQDIWYTSHDSVVIERAYVDNNLGHLETLPLLAMPEELAKMYGTIDPIHKNIKSTKPRYRAFTINNAVNAYRAYYNTKIFKNGKLPSFTKMNDVPDWYKAPTLQTAIEDIEL